MLADWRVEILTVFIFLVILISIQYTLNLILKELRFIRRDLEESKIRELDKRRF